MTTYRHKARGTPGGYQLKAGTLALLIDVADVIFGTDRGDGATGTCHVPPAYEVRYGVSVDVAPTVGSLTGVVDGSGNLWGLEYAVESVGGLYHEALPEEVQDGVLYGASLELEGTYDPMAAARFPAEANVSTVETAWGPTGAEYAGLLDLGDYTLTAGIVWPAEANVSTVEAAWGPTGVEYAGSLDLGSSEFATKTHIITVE